MEGGERRPSVWVRRGMRLITTLSRPSRRSHEWAYAAILCLTVTGALYLLRGVIGYWSVALIYLLSVVLGALYLTRWPVLALAGVSALLWNFLFIPPQFTFRVHHTHDLIMFVTYFAVAIVLGHLGSRVRERERELRRQEQRANTLYTLTRSLLSIPELKQAMLEATRQLKEVLQARSVTYLLIGGPEPAWATPDGTPANMPHSDMRAANTCVETQKPVGRFTAVSHGSNTYFHPLVSKGQPLGVLAIAPVQREAWTREQTEFIQSFSALVTVALEKDTMERATREARVRAESEKLQEALLDSVSHELKTPLAVIAGMAEQLERADQTGRPGTGLVSEIRIAAQRLSRTVNSLLDMTRLESGRLQPQLDWQDVQDIVNAAVASVADQVQEHPIRIQVPADLAPVRVDFVFIQHAIGNLLSNAARFSPRGAEIRIDASISNGDLWIDVADLGKGVERKQQEKIFEKFYRDRSAPPGGLGLGLSIARRFIEVHGGAIRAIDQVQGGACFRITLPVEKFDNRTGIET